MEPNLLPGEKIEKVNEDITLISKKDGLNFGTDAYLLAAFIREEKNAIAADLGSGTGILPLLLLARGKVKSVTAIEVQPEFADLITRNASLNHVEDRLTVLCADVRDLPPKDDFDIVFSNPPYMKVDCGKRNTHDEKFIARHEVCGDIGDFCAAAARLLRYGGKFYVVFRPDRLSDLFAALCRNSLEPKVMTCVCADAESRPSVILVEARKGGKSGLTLTRPLFLSMGVPDEKGNRAMTPDAEKIYQTCCFSDFL